MEYLVSNFPNAAKNKSVTFASDIVTNSYFCVKVEADNIDEAATIAIEHLGNDLDEVDLCDVLFVFDQDSLDEDNPFVVETKLILSNAGLYSQANNF